MSPVEGERSFGDFVTKLDSTDPGTIQPIDEFSTGIYKIQCDDGDSFGALITESLDPNVTVEYLKHDLGVYEQTFREYLRFSGDERVRLTQRVPGTEFVQKIVLWHHAGDSEQPPFRLERVPLRPTPPLDTKEEALEPGRERELVGAVSR